MPAARSSVPKCSSTWFLGLSVGILGLSLAGDAVAQSTPTLVFQPMVTVLEPTDIAHAGDARLFVTSKPGVIRIVANGVLLPAPFLDIQDRVRVDGTANGEQGLLSVAFHPDYGANGYFFVSYVANDGDSVIARYRVSTGDPNRAERASERILLEIPQPGTSHNVGPLRFGRDGMLYIAGGDGGYLQAPRCTSQQGDNLLGKVLRIDVDRNVGVAPYYGVPSDNPFVGTAGVRNEIWALGLRNPWRFSFDRLTGDMYIGDPGQDLLEEVDVEVFGAPGGRNYGWKRYEGTACVGNSQGCGFTLPPCGSSAYTPPAFAYGHANGRCAVIGGHVYRGTAFPVLAGTYVFGDYCGQLWAGQPSPGGSLVDVRPLNAFPLGLVGFGEDVAGELYAIVGSTIYRLADAVGFGAPGTVAFAESTVTAQEGESAAITVRRSDGADGAVSVSVSAVAGTADAADHGGAFQQTVAWSDGDAADRTVLVPLTADGLVEGDETFDLVLGNPSGGVDIGVPAQAEVTIVDGDLPGGICVADAETLCLNDGRFRVSVDWRTGDGRSGMAAAEPLTTDAGWFWFFRFGNPEIFVKVLDACDANGHFWVFTSGLTDLETTLVVVDTGTGQVRRWETALGEGFESIRDTRAFATCP